jgi:hypothetical protein
MTIRYFAFVSHDRAREHAAKGWNARAISPGSHGEYSQVMVWEGEGEPPAREPKQREEAA